MTTILDDVLLALEETAAEQFANEERCGLLLAAHNEIVRVAEVAAEIDNCEDPEE